MAGSVRGVVLRRDDEEAESAFRKALRLAPNNNAARMSLANFLWAAGRADEGEEPLRQWADVSSEALPKRILGRFCVSRGRIAEGEQYLKVAAATGDRDARLDLADHYMATERAGEALTILGEITDSDDPSGAISLRKADLEFRSGKRVDAVRRVDAVLGKNLATRAHFF